MMALYKVRALFCPAWKASASCADCTKTQSDAARGIGCIRFASGRLTLELAACKKTERAVELRLGIKLSLLWDWLVCCVVSGLADLCLCCALACQAESRISRGGLKAQA